MSPESATNGCILVDNKSEVSKPCTRASATKVVRRLKDVCRKLSVTESNVELFSKMTRNTIATNDVRSFMVSQSKKQSASNKVINKCLSY